eukprot:2271060-Ditylum_brightwellii.AAC.1
MWSIHLPPPKWIFRSTSDCSSTAKTTSQSKQRRAYGRENASLTGYVRFAENGLDQFALGCHYLATILMLWEDNCIRL